MNIFKVNRSSKKPHSMEHFAIHNQHFMPSKTVNETIETNAVIWRGCHVDWEKDSRGVKKEWKILKGKVHCLRKNIVYKWISNLHKFLTKTPIWRINLWPKNSRPDYPVGATYPSTFRVTRYSKKYEHFDT